MLGLLFVRRFALGLFTHSARFLNIAPYPQAREPLSTSEGGWMQAQRPRPNGPVRATWPKTGPADLLKVPMASGSGWDVFGGDSDESDDEAAAQPPLKLCCTLCGFICTAGRFVFARALAKRAGGSKHYRGPGLGVLALPPMGPVRA